MGLFRTFKKADGWRAIGFQGGEVRVVHVVRPSSGKPMVSMAVSAGINGASPGEILDRFARAWHHEQYQCTTFINFGEYQFLPVEAPNVPANELKSAISWLVKDMLDFHIDEATIDVLEVPQEKAGTQRGRSMYAVATRSGLVKERQAQFESAKLPLRVIDVPEMCQRNIAALLEEGGRGVALVYFDDDGGMLTFSAGGELYLARRIDVPRTQLLDDDAGRREMYQERVALEIQRSLDHFGRQYSGISIGRLLVAPIGDQDGGLCEFLSHNLDAKVEALDLGIAFNLSTVPELKGAAGQQRYFLALGAALRVEEKVL